MPKIVFIGAGSLGFTRGLVRDLMTFPLLKDAELALVDIDAERLEFAKKACKNNQHGQLSCSNCCVLESS